MHDHLKNLARRGIVLPVCLSLLFSMLVLALALAQQARAHLGFAMLVESETKEREAAFAALCDLSSILQYSADPATWNSDLQPSVMGLPNPLPTPDPKGKGSAVDFHNGSDIDVKIAGEFGGSAQDASLYLPPPTGFDPAANDSYITGTRVTNGGAIVPPRFSALYVDASVPSAPRSTFIGMYTANYPFGVISMHSTVSIKDIFTTGDYPGQPSNETGIPAPVFAAKGITLGAVSNVRLYAPVNQGATSQGHATAAATNLSEMPKDFEAALATAKGAVTQNLTDKGADIQHLAECRHANIPDSTEITSMCTAGTAVAQFNPGNSDISTIKGATGTDLNQGSNTFQVASRDFVVPSHTYISVPYNFDIQGNLLLMPDSVLSVKGKLSVHGDLYMSQQTSLVVGDETVIDGLVDMVYRPSPNVSLTASILSTGDVTLSGGMQSHEQGVKVPTDDAFAVPACPFQPSTLTCMQPNGSVIFEQVANPNCDKYNKQAQNCVSMNNAAFTAFLQRVAVQGSASTTNVGGIFVNTDGQITLGGTADSKVAGLFVAGGNITCVAGHLVGAMWSRNGTINASATSVRYFPYWTHAYVHSASGDTAVTANRYWRVGFGRVLQQ